MIVLVLFVGLLGGAIFLIFGQGILRSSAPGIAQATSLQACPYECCDGGDYQLKSCQEDYRCSDHQCKPIDSDQDGLFDFEEKKLGTNPNLADTDGDTLSDYIEVKVKGTNPLSRNTDNDRYDDNVDREPTKKNTAIIRISPNSPKQETNIVAFGIAAATCYLSACTLMGVLATLAPDTWLSKQTWTVRIENSGDDYTSYVNGRFGVYCSRQGSNGDQVYYEDFSVGRIDSGQAITKSFIREVKLKDVPDRLIDIIVKGKCNYIGVAENLNYEKY